MNVLPAPGPHGGDRNSIAMALGVDPNSLLDLSLSLNPVAPDPVPIVARHLDAIGRYPDPTAAARALSDVMEVDPEQLLLTNGGAEAIALVAGEIGGTVVEPEFSLHPRSRGPLWRSNPHNPSGLLAKLDETADVWDEAFYPLATGDWTRGEGVVVGSLTKLLACPGLRAGYVLGDPDLVARCRIRQTAWSINALVDQALPDLLANVDLRAWSVAIAELRKALVSVLNAHGLVVHPSDANWVLVDHGSLRDLLAPRGVVVRDCASFGMPTLTRIAVPSFDGLQLLDRALSTIDLGTASRIEERIVAGTRDEQGMAMTSGSLLVLGTTSGAGKTTVVTGLCRLLSRRGVSVAPFKAQNMSLNSFVTMQGEEIGRAQATQARATRIEPEALMNPVLLKPGTDSRSQLVVLGHPAGDLDAASGWHAKRELLDIVVESFRTLQSRFDVVICEGAGSPAEINLRASDIVNLGFARVAGVPSVVVGDINPGGVFASFAGTLALLSHEDQKLVHGFIVNRFRGDRSLLEPGLEMMRNLTGRATYGVLPFIRGLGLDSEDALDPELYADPSPPVGQDMLRIGVIRLPRASNLTDLDPLAAEPGVVVQFITRPEEMADAHLVVLPGTRATVDDLAWLRERGFEAALQQRGASSLPILGICGGYQMLGWQIEDNVESGVGLVKGLGLLPIHTEFGTEKYLARIERTLVDESRISGYQIHHGLVRRIGAAAFFSDEGCRLETTMGTTWHGLFENDAFRRRYLSDVSLMTGRAFIPSSDICFEAWRDARIDAIADLVEEHLDVEALCEVLEGRASVPPRLTLSLNP